MLNIINENYHAGLKLSSMNRTLKKEGHGTTRDNVVWTSEMDNVLIDGLLEEQRKGNRRDGMFRSELTIILGMPT